MENERLKAMLSRGIGAAILFFLAGCATTPPKDMALDEEIAEGIEHVSLFIAIPESSVDLVVTERPIYGDTAATQFAGDPLAMLVGSVMDVVRHTRMRRTAERESPGLWNTIGELDLKDEFIEALNNSQLRAGPFRDSAITMIDGELSEQERRAAEGTFHSVAAGEDNLQETPQMIVQRRLHNALSRHDGKAVVISPRSFIDHTLSTLVVAANVSIWEGGGGDGVGKSLYSVNHIYSSVPMTSLLVDPSDRISRGAAAWGPNGERLIDAYHEGIAEVIRLAETSLLKRPSTLPAEHEETVRVDPHPTFGRPLRASGRLLEVSAERMVLLSASGNISSVGMPPSYLQAIDQLPPLPAGHGRIVVYSVDGVIKPIQAAPPFSPGVRLTVDDEEIGRIVTGGFVYTDVAAGVRVLNAFGRRAIEIEVMPAETSYVEIGRGRDFISRSTEEAHSAMIKAEPLNEEIYQAVLR